MRNCYAFDPSSSHQEENGRGGIRTHGGLPHARFRVECLKPDSATLPPARKQRRTLNVQHPTSNANAILEVESDADNPRWFVSHRRLVAGGVLMLRIRDNLADRIVCITPKNVTILGLPSLLSVLHLVCLHGQPRYYLLLTGIHRFLAPLFTSIRNLFRT